ncbi:MAG: succinate dehydrogenase [Deltaproteobacteria bacterium]|jgi:succinate dehydrogenase/fumarate reductase cytochrome b subunit
MAQEIRMEQREPLQWKELDPYRRRSTAIGMWAWIWQRISAMAIIVLLCLHLTLTYKPLIQFLLLVVVTFHAALGLRVILLDFNVVNVKYQKILIWGLLGLGLVVFVLIWKYIY